VTTRRVFLKAGGISLVTFGAVPKLLVRAALAAEAPRRRSLVVLFQRGACDGLNVVAPWSDPDYRAARPTIALAAPGQADGVLDLDGHFGLHPALAPLLPLWKDGRLAAVHAIGSPDATRSHFDAQDFMESGTPGRKATEDGWMNRFLTGRPEPEPRPLRAVSLTQTLPRSLQGTAPAVAMANLRSFSIPGIPDKGAARGFEDMYAGAVGDALQDSLEATSREAFDAMEALHRANPAQYTPAPGADYPRGPLGDALRQLAQLLKSDLGVELAFLEAGGWDHHVAEAAQLRQRLGELGGALAAFHADLGSRMDDVVLVTLTEFGRTVRENGSRGTDHGHGSVSLVLGGRVRGGSVHGRWPGMRPKDLYEGRDLPVTTDFRDLLAELLSGHLGATDLGPVFPGYALDPRRHPGVLRA